MVAQQQQREVVVAIERRFLGWQEPLLCSAARYLTAEFGCNLSESILVVTTRRASRRLVELLVAHAEAENSILIPPKRIISVGELPELFYSTQLPFASKIERIVAWQNALEQTKALWLSQLTKSEQELEQLSQLSLAERLDSLWSELSAANLSFAHVAQHTAELCDFGEDQRWSAFVTVFEAYLQQLLQSSLVDKNYARQQALASAQLVAIDAPLFLLGAVDLNTLSKSYLQSAASRCVALVQAPQSQAADFDDFGCIVVSRWKDKECPLQDTQIHVGQRSREQVRLALAFLEQHGENRPLDDVTVGVADASLIPYALEEFRAVGTAIRSAEGVALADAAPLRLLNLAASYAAQRKVPDFAALIRHADFSQYLAELTKQHPARFLALLDTCIEEHVAQRVETILEIAGSVELAALVKQVNELLREMSFGKKTLEQWVDAFSNFLDTIYNSIGEAGSSYAAQPRFEACKLLAQALVEVSSCRMLLAQEELSLSFALQLVNKAAQALSIPNEMGEVAIELLGWLELALDDAPVVFVLGLNEGIVPESINADAFMPNNLRQELGLSNNDSRFARDMYILSSLAQSRKQFAVSYAKRNTKGEMLLPSRLLLMTNPQSRARRILQFCGKDSAPELEQAVAAETPRISELNLGFPASPQAAEITLPSAFAVTAYQQYLQCPYRFYLRHILKLRRVDDSAKELSAQLFGTLAHSVLASFGASADAVLNDAPRIAKSLLMILDETTRRELGSAPPSSVLLQLELLKMRLLAFAEKQSQWRKEGWKIHSVEVAQTLENCFVAEGVGKLGIRGRLDRIDYNESLDAWAVLDYKTGESPENINSHFKDEWKHLQLPLYYLLFQARQRCEKLHLGFVNLAKDTTRVGFAEREFSDAEVQPGIELAQECADAILQKIFWPPKDGQVGVDEFADICSAGMFAEIDADDDEESYAD
jgi:RecB family exonuclease